MTQYTKPTVLPAWGESAGGADVLQPTNAEIQAGWPLSNVPPSRKRFNWILKYLAQGVRYMMQMGIPVWDATEDYPVYARVMGSNGKTYMALQTSTNQNPVSAPAYWQLWGTDGRDNQLQLTTAFTTAGTAPNFTLTPVPAPAALAANLRLRVKFHAAGAGADQINIAGLGNKAIKQYDSTGTKIAATVVANQLADIEYDGVDLVILDPLPPAASVGNFAGLNSGNVTATLSLTDLGKLYAFYGSTAGQILTLPALASVGVGKNMNIVNQASVSVTVKGNAAENISSNTAGSGQALANTIVLNPGDSVILSGNGGTQWNAWGYTSVGQFPNSKTSNGYQKLPNGLIIQWGVSGTLSPSGSVTVTFPIAFPSGASIVTGCLQGSAYSYTHSAIFASIISATQVTFTEGSGGGAGGAGVMWIAIGA
jgi:hypothetical protein